MKVFELRVSRAPWARHWTPNLLKRPSRKFILYVQNKRKQLVSFGTFLHFINLTPSSLQKYFKSDFTFMPLMMTVLRQSLLLPNICFHSSFHRNYIEWNPENSRKYCKCMCMCSSWKSGHKDLFELLWNIVLNWTHFDLLHHFNAPQLWRVKFWTVTLWDGFVFDSLAQVLNCLTPACFASQRSHHLPCKLHGAAVLSVRTYADKAASKLTVNLIICLIWQTLYLVQK